MKRLVMTAALVITGVLMAAQPAAASWLQQGTPVPSGASVWQFNAVSCTAPSSCMAVGSANGLLAETRSGNTWTVVSIPDPGGGQLTGISCTSTSACEAVGSFDNGGTTETLAEVWNGSNWTIQSARNPAGATSSQLSEVSCRSASACEAVGQFTSGGATQTLAEGWDGSSWTIQSTPNVGSATNSVLSGVSCPSASVCEAVGDSSTGPNSATLAEVWNGSSWAVQSTPNTASTVNQLLAVSCTSAGGCTATGNGLAERWNGTGWALQTIASPHGNTAADLSGVSCTDNSRCMAVGSYFSKEAIQTMVAERWDGTKWTVVSTPLSTVADSTGLGDVSCTHATTCTAVGFYHDPVDGNRALAEDWSLRWQLQAPQIPTGAIAGGLQTVSCPFVNFCAAVGGDEQSGSVFNAVVETWNGRNWFVGTTPNASNSVLSGVSCNGAKACTAVGDAVGGGSTLVSLAERYDGTNWTVQSTPNPAGAVHSFLTSVSCASVKTCTAVGFFTDGSGNQFPFAEQWNGTSWSLQTPPAPTGSTTAQLNGVSCTSSTACEAVGSDNTHTWAEVWNGTTWAIQNIATPSGGQHPFVNGVDCTAANACTAVGDYINASSNAVPLAERWNGSAWSVQNVPVPSGSTSEFSSVSCSTTQFNMGCNAVGFVTKNGISLPMAENWNGSTWAVRPTQSPDPNVSRSTMSSVSCSTLITCMGVGFYDTSTGVEAPVGEQYS
jgi:hypothetical protein